MEAILVLPAIVCGALWRRWLGMAEENRHMRRPYQIAIGFALALALVALPAWSWWAIIPAVLAVLWLIAPAEYSNFWMTDLISRWSWPKWFMTETSGPRPWSEFFVGGLGFGVAATIALFAIPALAHDPYTKWQQANGASCCNKSDCRPAVVRWQPTGWQVRLHGTWCDIPADKVRNYKTPDGGPHVCAPLSPLAGKCQMYCFVHGETKL